MKWLTLCLLALVSCANADEGISALVRTSPMVQRTLSARIEGYGITDAGPEGGIDINSLHAGQILTLGVVPGQRVKKGQLLFELKTDPVSSRDFEQARSALEFAGKASRHVEALFRQKLATGLQYDAARKALQDAQAAYSAQRRLGSGSSLAKIRAPFSGVVASVSATRGARISAGNTVMKLIEDDGLLVRIGVEPEDTEKISIGMPVELFPVFDESRHFPGKVRTVGGVVDPATGLVEISVRPDKGSKIMPGTRMKGEITVSSARYWAVPGSAVLTDDKGAYIFQDDKGRARRIRVGEEIEEGGWMGVSGKFDPALPVVVQGNYELKEGMALREESR